MEINKGKALRNINNEIAGASHETINALLEHFAYSIADIQSWDELTDAEKKIMPKEIFEKLTFAETKNQIKEKTLKKIISTTETMLKNYPKTMKFKVIGIDWDCFADPSHYNLPIETIIEAEDEDDVVDELSDKYGWCINSVEDIIPIP